MNKGYFFILIKLALFVGNFMNGSLQDEICLKSVTPCNLIYSVTNVCIRVITFV